MDEMYEGTRFEANIFYEVRNVALLLQRPFATLLRCIWNDWNIDFARWVTPANNRPCCGFGGAATGNKAPGRHL